MSERTALAPVITDADLPETFTRDMDNERLMVRRPPEHVLEEAQQAARALKRVIDDKAKPVRFNGETYLEFEDWQTVGRFYGVTCQVTETERVDYGSAQGFSASAVALRSDGQVISRAESMCLNDETNWAKKPLFQLRSMAQTRACAKALRNVLAWVVVLAGYRPTPAEEMDGVDAAHASAQREERPAREPAPAPAAPAVDGDKISEPQQKRLYAIARGAGSDDAALKQYLQSAFGIDHTRDLLKRDYDQACEHFGVKNERKR